MNEVESNIPQNLHSNLDMNDRRQILLNHVFLVETAHQQGHSEAYEELKRLIIFAGIFFLFMIIFVLLKFQVSLDDVFKWSPVVWLVGVIICGLLMNIFIQIKKFFKRRRAKRLREQQNLLYSLNLPNSFPCLAPPPHNESCCECMADVLNERYGMLNEVLEYANLNNNQQQIPSYEQIMKGAKTWLLSTPNSASTALNLTNSTETQVSLPPSYSTVNIATQNLSNVNNDAELSIEEQRIFEGYSDSCNEGDIPPPIYQVESSTEQIIE